MKVFRSVSIALAALAMLAASGCRTAGVGNLSKQPSLFPTRTNESAAELLVEHNRNAGRVDSIMARPNITVTSRRMGIPASGKLALERPRNFKLELSVGMSDVANIGSNDEKFWFWVKDSEEKAVYYCDYDEDGTSPLGGSLQPDWITETLGMRVISDQESADMKVRPGVEPGTLVLSHEQTTSQGETVFKEIVINEQNHRIREHRVYAKDHKTLLAHARIAEYLEVAPSAPPSRLEDGPDKVYLPKKLKLEWLQERLSLEIQLSNVELNPVFDKARRDAIFVEPNFRGFKRLNLADRVRTQQPASSSTTVRETMPAPAPRIKLSDPTPLGLDGARRTPRNPVEIVADLPANRPVEIEAVVGPTIPTVAEPLPGSLDNRSGWRNSIER